MKDCITDLVLRKLVWICGWWVGISLLDKFTFWGLKPANTYSIKDFPKDPAPLEISMDALLIFDIVFHSSVSL